MNLQEKISHYWHIPTAAIAFQKWLLENRGIQIEHNLDAWKVQLKGVTNLTETEQNALQTIIQRIDADITDYTLEVFYSLIKDTIVRYKDNRYAILKYLQAVTYEDAWNNWYYEARGVVIDLEKVEVATAALPKFFNVNEKPFTFLSVVLEKMKVGHTTKYIKQDGSCLNVSNRENLLISTPGSFDSSQAQWAYHFLSTNFPSFLAELSTKWRHLTFTFEYVGPENRIVVVYPQTDMVLLHIRNAETGEILPYEKMKEIADTYGMTPCDVVHDSLETLMKDKEDKSKYKADDQEGWIIRIDDETGTFMTKLKCSDYISMHRMVSNALNPRWVYEALVNETFDDAFAQIESDSVRTIVNTIREKIVAWTTEKKDHLEQVYQQIPTEQWASDELLQNFRSFEKEVDKLTDGRQKGEKIKLFLHQFAKGKLNDPKEEIREKAQALYEAHPLDSEKLDEYNMYRMFVNKQIEQWLKQLKQLADEFVYKGVENKEYASWLQAEFGTFFHIEKGVDNLESWEETFAKNKEEFYRLAQMSKENLTSQYFAIHHYAKNKYLFEKKKVEVFSLIKKAANAYVLREGNEPFVQEKLEQSLVINEELYAFYQAKKQVEETAMPSFFNQKYVENYPSILKEYYVLARGEEFDNSYSEAKKLYATLDSSIQNQKMYFQAKGKFSGYVHKNIEKFYQPFIFNLFQMLKEERMAYIREADFLSLATIAVDPSKQELSEVEIDFRDIHSYTKDIALDE